MKKQTYQLLAEALQLMTVIMAVIILTLGFYGLSRIMKPIPQEAVEDQRQMGEMEDYHQSQGRTNLRYYP